jgi:hypothetical protein
MGMRKLMSRKKTSRHFAKEEFWFSHRDPRRFSHAWNNRNDPAGSLAAWLFRISHYRWIV